jgi:hypothetical protein
VYDSLPAHWKVLLHKVEPQEAGTPYFRDIFVSGITAKGVKKIINAAGLPASALQNFHFNNLSIEGTSAGDIAYATGWVFSHTLITGADGKKLQVTNSADMKLPDN